MRSGGTQIDPTAQIDPQATIGRDVSIGPYCNVGPNVTLADGVRLVSHVHVTGHTEIGGRTIIYPFASLGTPPQSVKYKGEPTRLLVGSDCDIRENVTMNTGTAEAGGITRVGNGCFLMVGSHVAHDCTVGNEVTFANNVVLGGHVTVGDYTVFGGQAAMRQYVRIGEGAMVVGLSGVRADIIPWGLVSGHFATLVGLNVVGMRRRGWSKADIHRLRAAFRAAFFGAGMFRERVENVAATHGDDPRVARMIEFIRSGKRPLTMATDRGDDAEAP
jgi:UDP-N-acetylglucosamine acyltransferase